MKTNVFRLLTNDLRFLFSDLRKLSADFRLPTADLRLLVMAFSGIMLYSCSSKPDYTFDTGTDYPVYGGNKSGNRYSPLNSINRDNVNKLDVAWIYDASTTKKGDIQCQPIIVRGVLYATTPDLNLFALEAGTGKQIWKFKPKDRPHQNRGVAYWEDKNEKRILYSVGPHLYAINASTGESINSFGDSGRVDLHEGLQTLDADVSKLGVNATTPGIVFKNMIIMGSATSESGDAVPGHIRAFDVITGKLKWVFHTIPQPGEAGYETWPKDAYKKIGAANCWSGFTLDENRGVVYMGTGSPAVDFYGGDRQGDNLYANCILALDAETGKLKWYYQTIKHDLWDRDHPSPPNLATIKKDGKDIDVVVQATKDGLVFVLDRDSGKSMFPVEERAVPTADALPNEHPSATQKFPLKPSPLMRQIYTEADIPNDSPSRYKYLKDRFDKLTASNKFSPPSKSGTLLFGYSGGAEWGGNAVDPQGIFYQNVNEEPWELFMQDTAEAAHTRALHLSAGETLYQINCSSCHGAQRKGSGPELPSLIGISKKYSGEEIRNIIRTGKGRMPSFSQLTNEELQLLSGFLMSNGGGGSSAVALRAMADKSAATRRAMVDMSAAARGSATYRPALITKRWERFTDEQGYPGIKPPWGTLNAIDLNTGEYLWRVPLGEYPELTKKGIPVTGTTSYGGPLVTGGGLLFIAGTKDEKFRAFDTKTGKIVWEYQLPAGGFATPVTYEVNGKQFIVIAAGGGRGQKMGGNYIAFALK